MWPQALEIIQSDTVRRWRRQRLWQHLRWRCGRKRPGRPSIPTDTRKLSREMSRDNRLWGAPRLHGELAKLGIKVSRTTVATYMIRRIHAPSPTWRTFIRNPAPDLVVAAINAELSGQLRTVSSQVVRAVQRWLRKIVSSCVQRFRCHHAQPFTEQTDMERTDVSLDSSVMNGSAVSPKLLLNLQAGTKEQRTDVLELAAA